MADDGAAVPADPVLHELYNSDRPAVELLPGMPLSPLINSCWLPGEAKALLSETWIPAPPEDTGDASAAPAPAFNAAAPEYNVLVRRLSKSAPFQRWNDLMARIKVLEQEASSARGAEAEAKATELEAARAALAEAEAAVMELKASFQDDPLSLVPWMQALTELADAGLSTFEVSGACWPYCNLRSLFGDSAAAAAAGFFDGVERVLGTFKRRYERERGTGRIQLLLKLAPNIFQDGFGAPGAAEAAIVALVDRARANVYGAESAEPLDLVQLVWWDPGAIDPLPVLKVLQRLATDALEVNEESGEVTITEPKKIRGIGLVDFPADVLKAALQSGVPITCVQVEHSVACRGAFPVLELCRAAGVKVLARGGTLGGLLSEKYVGVAPPDSARGDADLDSVPASLDAINNLGGWEGLQRALSVLQGIAAKHHVTIETVALRWQIDQGTFPLVSTRWGAACWRQFGYDAWSAERRGRPGVDPALFAMASFLDVDDVAALDDICAA